MSRHCTNVSLLFRRNILIINVDGIKADIHKLPFMEPAKLIYGSKLSAVLSMTSKLLDCLNDLGFVWQDVWLIFVLNTTIVNNGSDIKYADRVTDCLRLLYSTIPVNAVCPLVFNWYISFIPDNVFFSFAHVVIDLWIGQLHHHHPLWYTDRYKNIYNVFVKHVFDGDLIC